MRSIAFVAAALLLSAPAFAQYKETEVKDGGSIEGKISLHDVHSFAKAAFDGKVR